MWKRALCTADVLLTLNLKNEQKPSVQMSYQIILYAKEMSRECQRTLICAPFPGRVENEEALCLLPGSVQLAARGGIFQRLNSNPFVMCGILMSCHMLFKLAELGLWEQGGFLSQIPACSRQVSSKYCQK